MKFLMWSTALVSVVAGCPSPTAAQQVDWPSPRLPQPKLAAFGPYNAEFIAGGDTIVKQAQGYVGGERIPASGTWTLTAWIKSDRRISGRVEVARLGKGGDLTSRSLDLVDGRASINVGGRSLVAETPLQVGKWHHVGAVDTDGIVRLYVDGREVAKGHASEAAPEALIVLGQRNIGKAGFVGRLAAFVASPRAYDAAMLRRDAAAPPNESLVRFETNSPSWPLQVRTQYGEAAPQRAWTLPKGIAAFSAPKPISPSAEPPLLRVSDGSYSINDWRMIDAPSAYSPPETISSIGYNVLGWHRATVPGTVLTTLVDRGVYPDPRIGLNNMAIPEVLARQDYWYRTEFDLPGAETGKRQRLILNGINYHADVWVNGQRVGDVKGAFIRGRFDVTKLLKPGGRNSIAIRISPPPHPGIPHEQSMTAGRGENGGAMMIDGPTFTATEGWDWIPGVRDRNAGLWQNVELQSTDDVSIGDPQVVTDLPEADNSVADIFLDVPVTNASDGALDTTVRISFDDVSVARRISIPAKSTVVARFEPTQFPTLRIKNPKLWWPNGYGTPALHRLKLAAEANDRVSDRRELTFGMRKLTYELSSLDDHGDLERIDVDLAKAKRLGTPVIDERNAALRKVPNGWANSLRPGAQTSPAVRKVVSDPRLSPNLVLRVNGVRIAARGGNWGMDEMMKRVERQRLEPYFRLHKDAGLNIIRNWMGQSTEENFYQLADEYGMLIINDFWESTQDNNAEAEDVPLFVGNARDVVRRFRTHPSIALWIGRNEGVPQPILQAALQDMVWDEDGGRLYKGSSRIINLGGSGPYNWRSPEGYFTDFAKGFAVEVGTPSFPTLESWQRTVPQADRWPINDTWAYHDWHQERAVSVASFMEAMKSRLGEATSLPDFERKAQLLNYESHRAIFEGFNAGLWKTNSARMLWMSHPAWPSADFQIYSSDYDTHASFYGTRKGTEPVHIQMNLPDRRILLANTTTTALKNVTVTARIVSLAGTDLSTKSVVVDAEANDVTDVHGLDIDKADGLRLIKLTATDVHGRLLSENLYW
ncbi:MAG: LamG-like jellyroll fold domain-containing protein, partial [Rhizorhabdus sp.]